MDLYNYAWIAAGVVLVIFLFQMIKRMNRDPEIDMVYKKILLSEEHKVKGRFEE